MKIRSLPALALALCGLLVQPLAQAQQSSAPASAAPSSDAVRDALAKKEGDADNTTLLKETLTAVDKQYSLIRKGQVQVNYELGVTDMDRVRDRGLLRPIDDQLRMERMLNGFGGVSIRKQ